MDTAIDPVTAYLETFERLRAAKRPPSKDLAFSLAAGITLAEDSKRAEARSAGDLAALQAIRAILDAQQAVMVATITASTASSSAAAGSG